MKALEIDYTMTLEFSNPVNDHYFLLRCVPVSRGCQTVTSRNLEINPGVPVNCFSDVFGNISYQGYAGENHNVFSFHSTATVITDAASGSREPCPPLYKYSTPLTKCTENMEGFMYGIFEGTKFLDSIKRKRVPKKEIRSVVELLRNAVHSRIEYTPNSTNVKTSAAEAFEAGKGVCQDYAHILCALCRECGIPARYVAGTSRGEGTTHAWTEYFVPDEQFIKKDGTPLSGKWFGADPTRNKFTDDTYVILAAGRDFSDCRVDTGIFRGTADQTMTVFVKTTELPLPEGRNAKAQERRFLPLEELKKQQQQ